MAGLGIFTPKHSTAYSMSAMLTRVSHQVLLEVLGYLGRLTCRIDQLSVPCLPPGNRLNTGDAGIRCLSITICVGGLRYPLVGFSVANV